MENASKKTLITGSKGFLGKHLMKALSGYELICFDIEDGDAGVHDFCDTKISHVFHLAAKTNVRESWDAPYSYYETNVMGTVNLLEFCRKIGASMTYVNSYPYGSPEYLPIDEKHPCNPNSVYNHSKYLAEDICRFYAAHYGVSVTVLRLFNVYGSGQNDSFLIPHIIKQALYSSRIELMDLEPKRDYVYVADVIEAMTLTAGLDGFRIYNVGSGEARSVRDVCDCILTVAGVRKPIVSQESKRKNEVTDIAADITKIRTELNWNPRTSFEDGIKQTIRHYEIGE